MASDLRPAGAFTGTRIAFQIHAPTRGATHISYGGRSNCNAPASLRMLGKRLQAVRVAIVRPTDSGATVPVMEEIGYMGGWNFGCRDFTHRMPAGLRPTALKLAYETNVRMLGMVE